VAAGVGVVNVVPEAREMSVVPEARQ
jgi:hypothetical protein